MPTSMRRLQGLGVSEGVAIGRAVCLQSRLRDVYRFPLDEDKVEEEIERLKEAVRHAEGELARVRGLVGGSLGDDLEGIFEAHTLILNDPKFLGRVTERIREEQVNAEWAVHRTTEELSQKFLAIENKYLRDRNQDLLDVGGFLLRQLQGIAHHEISEIEGDVVVVADDLPPAEALRLGRERVVGFAIEAGSRTSHTTILARSLKVPLVTGLEGITNLVTDEDPVIIDGEAGQVVLHPTAETLAGYRLQRTALEGRDVERAATRDLEARTLDGVRIQLMANIDLPEEIEDAVCFGADGVGLYRSEFLYIEHSPELPSEEDHLEIYRRLAQGAAPNPVIIRTLDLGGRKLAREVMDTREENPVLGLRGIRLTMARPTIFRTQLRALFRAACFGNVWVMLPLVNSVEEVRAFKAFAGEVFEGLRSEGLECRREVKLGVMIEVPSAAMSADLLAREVDFFSIGTNDLIQYSLAVDRANEHVANLYQPLHPAILRMLRFIVTSAREAGIELSLCGEVAADPQIAPLLVGLGLRRLSMSPRVIPAIKTRLRSLSVEALEALAEECRSIPTGEEVERHLAAFLRTSSLRTSG